MCGPTEEQCIERAAAEGWELGKSVGSFRANSKALAEGEGAGMAKVLFNKETGKVVAVHIIGLHAADLIQECANAVAAGTTVQELSMMVHVSSCGITRQTDDRSFLSFHCPSHFRTDSPHSVRGHGRGLQGSRGYVFALDRPNKLHYVFLPVNLTNSCLAFIERSNLNSSECLIITTPTLWVLAGLAYYNVFGWVGG